MKDTHRAGFTLIELLVVVLIIGILAAIAVPQYFKVVEKGKFAEPMNFIASAKGAQERFLARNGTYAAGAASTVLDVNPGTMTKFTPGNMTTVLSGTSPTWSIVITRNTPAPAGYGAYEVTYTGPAGTFSCNNASCTADLIPQ